MAIKFNINLEDARYIVNSIQPHEDWIDRAERWEKFGCIWDGDAADLYAEAINIIKESTKNKFYAAHYFFDGGYETHLFFGTEENAERFFDNITEKTYRLCEVNNEVTQVGFKEVETGKFRRVFGMIFPDNTEGYFVDTNNEV